MNWQKVVEWFFFHVEDAGKGSDITPDNCKCKNENNGNEYIKVGRWMTIKEYNLMRNSNQIQEGSGGQTYVSTPDPNSYCSQAKPGCVYVEFEVPKLCLLQGGRDDWYKLIGPNAPPSQIFRLQKQGGEMLPNVRNVSDILLTK